MSNNNTGVTKSESSKAVSAPAKDSNKAALVQVLDDVNEKRERQVHRLKASACPINSVTVYNDRAEITRTLTVDSVEIGPHDVVVYDLSPEIQPDSIRVVGGEGTASIIEVSHEEVFGDREDLDQTALYLKKIESLIAETAKLNSRLDRNKKERVWLEGFAQTIRTGGAAASNPALAGSDLNVEGFLKNTSEFLSYYAAQHNRLDESDTETQTAIKDTTAQIASLKKKISSLQQHQLAAFRREVTIVLSVSHSTKIVLQVTYLIMNAHWTPSYDVRMEAEDKELGLIYFGSITNASGEDWNDVKLFLSTASPSVGGAPPPLRTMRVDINRPNYYRQQPQKKSTSKLELNADLQRVHNDMMTNIDAMLQRGEQLDEIVNQTEQMHNNAKTFKRQATALRRKKFFGLGFDGSVNYGNTSGGTMTVMTTFAESSQVGAANATFEIPRRANIVSDNKPHKVTIVYIELKARLSHYATPDTSGYIYLKATAVNTTEQYPLLAGPMSIFMNDNFIAKSEMKDVSPGEKFSVFLGVDPGVKLDVKPLRRVQEKQTGIISKSNTESFRHLSIVKNTRKDKVNLTIITQIPLSGDDRIKVRLMRPEVKDNVKFIENKLIKWKLHLAPSQQEELAYQYTVEWPAGLDIVHLTAQDEES